MNPPSSASSPRTYKLGERRRKNEMLQRAKSSAEKIDQFRPLWNSMSLGEKQSLLQVSISDLRKDINSITNDMVKNYVWQGLYFVHRDKTWKFWACCVCQATYLDSERHMGHVHKEHIGKLRPEFLLILPHKVNSNWAEMLLKCVWKPVEASAAVNVIEDQSKCQYVLPVDDLANDELMQFNFDKWPEVYSLAQSWPLSSDSQREDLLEKIHNMFKMLLRRECLASSELNEVIQYTKKKLQGLTPKSRLLNHWLTRTPIGICFLGATELKEVLKQLQDYSRPFGFPRKHENISIVDETHTDTQNSEVNERIVLTDALLPLVLDELLLCNPGNSEKSSSSENSATETYILAGDFKDGAFADSDALLSSIFTGPTSAEQWLSWIHLDTEKVKEGMEILQLLKKEFSNLQMICERKYISLCYMTALEQMESDEDALQKRKLVERDKIALDAISNVLKEAKSLLEASSRLCDLESGKDGDGKTQDCLDQNDTRIKETIQRQKDARAVKLRKFDASIMQNDTVRQQLELKLSSFASLDYQTLILPSVKTIIQSRLEALAEKDAAVKSAAASEALLELVFDEKKSLSKGGQHSKPIQEKSKNKKKKKYYRKPKDSKVAGDIEPHAIFEETAEQGTEDFKQQEEDRLQMEAAAIQLEENLEYQRRIENEAKQKHLAEPNPEASQELYMPGGGGLPSDFSLDSLETAEQGHFPVASDQDSKSNISSTEDFKQQEEELRLQMEAVAIQPEEDLEYQRRTENEAALKHLAEPNPEAPQEPNMPGEGGGLPGDFSLDSLETAEQGHFPVASDQDSKSNISSTEDFKQQEEELRLQMEAVATQPEEDLEYQRRVENEAAQKHLAEPNPEAPLEPNMPGGGGGGGLPGDFSLDSLETAEQGHFPVASDQDSKNNISSTEDFKQQEEELRLQMEAAAIQPEEDLEYQRRIENEAAQKHLAEPNPEAPQEPNMPGGGGGLPSDFSLDSSETAEQGHFPVASDQDSKTVGNISSTEDLKQQEEDQKRIENETENSKQQEEDQRRIANETENFKQQEEDQKRIENEAKQKHLAKPNPKAPQKPYMPGGGGGGLPSAFSLASLEDFPPLPCASSSGSATHRQ